MSNNAIRQSEIFAGEDWTVLYRAFTQINFNAYDPASINTALRSYIQANYPEDFNDWIESSEFVAIIDLLSWLAGSLAFRTDVNARENFLESAESRESILRLSRFLSYTPRRAQSARGLVKLTEIRTSEGVEDSFGVNLSNKTIKWNDPDNPDWFEQFTLVLNATFPTTNPFGIPLKTANLGTMTNLYRINCVENSKCAYSFKSQIDGSQQPFEIVNIDIEEGSGFYERNPNPANGHHIVYRNDGKGNSSTRTGFFMLFKQGTLNHQDVGIANPIENRIIDMSASDISETDVWTQTLSSSGDIQIQWEKVPAIFSENITFNNIAPGIRNIFSVVTRDNDRVALRFGDGRFGNVPVGDIRIWYRTVNGLQYEIRPKDMASEQIVIPYKDTAGRTYNLTTTFSLHEIVSNAVGPEDLEQIRRRAPQVYGTQNRMVSGEDYNVFPLSSNEIVKMRAVNRVYSGHSRYLDINDPTSTIQDTVVFSDDGALYKENVKQTLQVPISASMTNEQIITKKIQPLLDNVQLRDYFLDYFVGVNSSISNTANPIVWNLTYSVGFNCRGYFPTLVEPAALMALPILSPSPTTLEQIALQKYNTLLNKWNNYNRFKTYFGVESQIKFRIPAGIRTAERFIWAKVISTSVSLSNFNDITIKSSNIILDEVIPDGAEAIQIIPAFRGKLDARATIALDGDSEFNRINTLVTARKPFKLYYVFGKKSSLQYGNVDLPGVWAAIEPNDILPASSSSVLVMNASYVNGLFWSFEILVGIRFIFESVRDVRWNNMHNRKVVDATNGRQQRDRIVLLSSTITDMLSFTGIPYKKTIDSRISFDIIDNVFDPDGYPDFRRVVVSPSDLNDDGAVDNPEAFSDVLALSPSSNPSDPLNTRLVKFEIDPTSNYNSLIVTPLQDVLDVTGNIAANAFGRPKTIADSYGPVTKVGVPNLRFQWKHYADTDVRIDPAITNIIDIFVLTSEYDFLVRQWVAAGGLAINSPTPPSSMDLKIAFQNFEQYKMFSDQIIWRPVKYKYLFGDSAKTELKAQFKIVRLLNSALSDGEIRSKVILAINTYFDVNKWEFGETFYFTELAAWIHLQLATAISSVVIVPLSNSGKFGELFEIRSSSDEVFISTAQVNDIVIIDGNTMSNLRIS